jgi:hypothetical protein
MSNYLIAGGSGFIGQALCQILQSQGHMVIVLTTQRQKISQDNSIRYVYWNTRQHTIELEASDTSFRVINLAGAGIADERWTESRKKELLQSRLDALTTLYTAAKNHQINIEHLLSTSAIGYFGNQTQLCTEDTSGDDSFLSQICQAWEKAAQAFETLHIPVAIVRLGIVLGKERGAFKELLAPLQFKLAAIPGSGKQTYSWIHLEDVCQIMDTLSEQKSTGIFNAVAPYPVSMDNLIDEMRHYRTAWLRMHVPEFLLKLLLGEMAIEVTKSTTVSSRKLQELGYAFRFLTIQEAVKNLLSS